MTLSAKQRLFAKLLPRLLDKAHELGFEVTLGETWRSDEQAAINAMKESGRNALADLLAQYPGFHTLAITLKNNGKGNGILLSVHCDRLAVDLNLFKDGVYQTSNEAHQGLGEWWEKQHELCRAGIRFRDANHYSIENGNRK